MMDCPDCYSHPWTGEKTAWMPAARVSVRTASSMRPRSATSFVDLLVTAAALRAGWGSASRLPAAVQAPLNVRRDQKRRLGAAWSSSR